MITERAWDRERRVGWCVYGVTVYPKIETTSDGGIEQWKWNTCWYDG